MRQVYVGVDWLFVTEAHTFKALRSHFYVAGNLCFGKAKAVVAFSAISLAGFHFKILTHPVRYMAHGAFREIAKGEKICDYGF